MTPSRGRGAPAFVVVDQVAVEAADEQFLGHGLDRCGHVHNAGGSSAPRLLVVS
ncbi:hypothetical protein J4573_40435 [Actinomadura barringtoniae]|uniref:Uncharacterized protein n=1 Tax=Actinomadura barringtoniae TaxID=1427535 RepID=A0A939PIA5_9ACTN|nr:hypothetical protein [Actinomadura barringtoniae]MBO2453417.1 hypothetical protein [Actinomadura barringtoniae]